MCAQVAPSAEYLRGHGRVAVDVTALRHLWQHLPVLGLVVLACVLVCAVVVAVCQLLIKTIIIIIMHYKCSTRYFMQIFVNSVDRSNSPVYSAPPCINSN